MNMNFKRKLPIPMEIKEKYPVTWELQKLKEKRDEEIKAIFEGRDDRFLLIIGPCSADKDDSVLDYIYRLRDVQEKVLDKILIFDSSEANEDINDMYEILKRLGKIILEFGEKFSKRKKEKKECKEMRTTSETSGTMLNTQHSIPKSPRRRRQKERAWENTWGDNSWKLP